MTTLELPDLETRPEPRRDRFGRYLIVPAAGGKPRPYTRATTWAKALDDMGGLINWSMRMCALGLTTRKDLYAQVAACRADDRSQLSKLVDQAKEAGGGSEGANIGSALHAFTERVDLGEDVTVPDLWRPDVDAYKLAIEDAGLTVRRDLVERVVVLEELGVAGTLDRVYVTGDGRLVIGDVKTGQSLDFSRLAIAVQLALYANAETLYDLGTETHQPMVDVDKQTALVVHLPSGQGRCQVVEFDIAEGWKYAQLAGLVRSARAHGKRSTGDALSRPYKPGQPAGVPLDEALAGMSDSSEDQAFGLRLAAQTKQPTTEPTRIGDTLRQWVLVRLDEVSKVPDARRTMKELWPAEIPKLSSGHPHSEAELRRLADCLDAVERTFEIGFGPSDPTVDRTPPTQPEPAPLPPLVDEGVWCEPGEVAAIIARVDALPTVVHELLSGWVREANAVNLSFSIKAKNSQRRYWIYEAILALGYLYAGSDVDFVRATIAEIDPNAALPTIPIGPIIGALTCDQAQQLHLIAAGYCDAPPPALTYDPNTGAVRWATQTTNNNEQDNS